jgi:cytoskeletal protein RodZ
MKKQYGIILALCVIATFFVGIAFGATDVMDNSSNMSETNITNTNATGANDSVQPVNTTIKPADTTVIPETTSAPVTPVRTTIQPTIPASTPKPSPGFGIVVTAVVLSILYVYGKRR